MHNKDGPFTPTMENSIDIFLSRPRKVLVFLSIWLPSDNWMFLHHLIQALVLASQYSFLLSQLIFVVLVWGDIDEVSEASYLLLTQASVCYKVTVFIVNKKNLKKLLDFMLIEIFASESKLHDAILSSNAKKVKSLCAFFLVSAIMSCTLWAIMPWFDEAETRSFPFKIWMPLSPQEFPQYVTGYLYQIVSVYISATLFFSVDSTTLSMMMFGCAQLEIIIDKIKQLKNVPSTLNIREQSKVIKENNKLFTQCIRQHQQVIRFIQLLEDTYHANIFFQLSGTVGIICIIGLRISIAEPSSVQFYSMLVYMVTMLSQLLLYCWCGHELTTRSEDLREWIYQCPWYEQDGPFRRSLVIALQCMKRPIIFKAGHYIALSRPTFVSILRSSYSYFAVLNQANNE